MAGFYDTELEDQKRTGKVTNIALPVLAALEAIGTSIATKGRNPSAHTLGIYKDIQSGRAAALDRALNRDKAAADSARQDKLLGFQEAEEGRRKSEHEREGKEREAKEQRIKTAIAKLTGTQGVDPSTGAPISGASGVDGLTDIDRVAMDVNFADWLTQKMKPQSMVYLPGEGGYVGVPRSGGAAPTLLMGPDGQPIKPKTPPPSFTPVVTGQEGGDQRTVFVDPRNPTRVVDPNLPKPAPAVKPLSAEEQNTIKMKLNSLKIAKAQLEAVKAANEEYKKGFLSGKWLGKAPTEAAERYDAAVSALKPTVSAITRIPGMGSMSDFETKLAMAPYPEPGKYDKTNDAAIAGLEQLIHDTESGYMSLSPSAEKAPATGNAAGGGANPTGNMVWRRAKDGKEYEYDATTKQPTGRSR